MSSVGGRSVAVADSVGRIGIGLSRIVVLGVGNEPESDDGSALRKMPDDDALLKLLDDALKVELSLVLLEMVVLVLLNESVLVGESVLLSVDDSGTALKPAGWTIGVSVVVGGKPVVSAAGGVKVVVST